MTSKVLEPSKHSIRLKYHAGIMHQEKKTATTKILPQIVKFVQSYNPSSRQQRDDIGA
jgi:hypothetical protein